MTQATVKKNKCKHFLSLDDWSQS